MDPDGLHHVEGEVAHQLREEEAEDEEDPGGERGVGLLDVIEDGFEDERRAGELEEHGKSHQSD